MHWEVRGRAYWFVPLVFGLASLGAVGFYLHPTSCPTGQSVCAFRLSGFTMALLSAGLSPLQSGRTTGPGIYWLVAIPVALFLACGFFLLRRRPRPLRSMVPTAVAGLVLLVALLGLGFVQSGLLPADFTVRGLVGLVVLSLTMLVMAVLERNVTLVFVSAGAVGVAFLANLYDIENVTGVYRGSPTAPNLIVPAIYFLLVALVLGIPDLISLSRRLATGDKAAPQAS